MEVKTITKYKLDGIEFTSLAKVKDIVKLLDIRTRPEVREVLTKYLNVTY